MIELNDFVVHGVSLSTMPDVDVSRTRATEPVRFPFNAPRVVLVDRDFAIQGRHNKCLYLPQETEPIENFGKSNIFRIGRRSWDYPLHFREPCDYVPSEHHCDSGNRPPYLWTRYVILLKAFPQFPVR